MNVIFNIKKKIKQADDRGEIFSSVSVESLRQLVELATLASEADKTLDVDSLTDEVVGIVRKIMIVSEKIGVDTENRELKVERGSYLNEILPLLSRVGYTRPKIKKSEIYEWLDTYKEHTGEVRTIPKAIGRFLESYNLLED